jgi:predicted HTH transcriptional regulator
MTKTELLELINLGEGLNIEFKENFSASVGKEICAFANTIGGYILFGVDDSGNVHGVTSLIASNPRYRMWPGIWTLLFLWDSIL